jgi:hypothetical protein
MPNNDGCFAMSLPQGLAGEARRLSTTIAAQELEAAAREGALTAAAEETAKAQSELAESQLHLQQAVADMQVSTTPCFLVYVLEQRFVTWLVVYRGAMLS